MAGQDGNDRIAELLKQACLPAAASPEFKARLRYRLNEQAAVMAAGGSRPLWQRPLLWIPATVLATAAVILIVYFVAFHSAPLGVTTRDATAVQTNAAILRGNLDGLGAADSVQVSFEWGTSEGYGNETTPELRDSSGDFAADLTGLAPNTTYYYRVKVVTPHGVAYGRPMEFTTGPAPPVVASTDAIRVKSTSATLVGRLEDLGSSDNVSVSFQWGLSTDYGDDTLPELMTGTGRYSADLTGLSPNTTYHFRARAVGDVTTYGADAQFTTKMEPPSVETNDATGVATTSATLNGRLASLGAASSLNVSFEYGTGIGAYSWTTADQTTLSAAAFSADLSGLAPGTVYYYRAKAVGDGASAYGEEKSFTTSMAQPAAATKDATDIAGTSAVLNGDLTSLGTADNVTVLFEWGVSGGSFAQVAAGVMEAPGAFHLDLDGLVPGTTYSFRTMADGDGDPVYGAERSFTTKMRPSVVTEGASQVCADSAALNGDLTSLGTATSVTVSFVWGTTEGGPYNDVTVGVVDSAGPFRVDLTGLAPETTYYFSARAYGDGVEYGQEMTFTTGALPIKRTWYLTSELSDSAYCMCDCDTSKPNDTVPIRSAPGSPDSVIWLANESLAGKAFPQDDWTVHLTLSHLTGEHEIVVEVGTWDGSSFVSQGSLTAIVLGTNDRDLYQFDRDIAVREFTLPSNGRVAVRVTVTDRCRLWVNVHVGGSQCYVTSPACEEPVVPAVTSAATAVEPEPSGLSIGLDAASEEEAGESQNQIRPVILVRQR